MHRVMSVRKFFKTHTAHKQTSTQQVLFQSAARISAGPIITVGHRKFVRAFIHSGHTFYWWADIMAGRNRAVSSSSSKAAKWQVTTFCNSIFEKWQQKFDREYQALSWLRCHTAAICYGGVYGKAGNWKLKRTAETDDGKWAWSRTRN